MAKDPAFLFYFRDFLVSTELMTSEEVGYYIRILCHMADKGRLTLKHMQSICKAYDTAYELHTHIKIDDSGLYYHPRLEFEIEKRRNYTQSRRENAKHMHKHMHKHMGNGNDNGNAIANAVDKGRVIKRREFIKPTIEEVKTYCLERNNTVDAQKWHDFYTAKDWMIGKNKMKDWKAAVRTWETKKETGEDSYERLQRERAEGDEIIRKYREGKS